MATPTQDEINKADFGSKPVGYENNIKDLVSLQLKDPSSAQYKFYEPQKGYFQDGMAQNFEIHYGWIIPIQYNAKNSYGGYVGFKPLYYFISKERIYDITLKYNSGYVKSL